MTGENCQREFYFPELLQIFFAIIGMIFISAVMFTLFKLLWQLIYVHLISRCCIRKLKDFGQWAVITGGSSGIGKAYAIQLAKRGMDIVIISNELQSLMTTASEIEKKYHVQCSFIHVDFTDGENAYQRVGMELQGKDIGILINCAGILGNMPCKFLHETESNVLIMIDLHIKTVVQLTRIILPSMLSKKKGVVVNVSSMSSVMPCPKFNVYSACKAFSDRFSRAIFYEYDKIHIQSLIPYFTSTRMIDHFIESLPSKAYIFTAKQLVKNSISTLTFTNYTTGFWINDINRWILENFIPKSVFMLILNKTLHQVRIPIPKQS